MYVMGTMLPTDELFKQDSNAINGTVFYKEGVVAPDHTKAMKMRTYVVADDDCVVGALAVMFFVLAVILYRRGATVLGRLKEFFATKRKFVAEQARTRAGEGVYVFMLILVGAISMSVIFLDDLMEKGGVSVTQGVPYWLFGAGVLVCMGGVYLKSWLYSFVNWIFFDRESSQRWLSGYWLLTSLMAYVFYPIALVDVFFHSDGKMVSLCAILVVVLYEMLLFYKLVVNFRVNNYGYLLIILYFCSVELLPAIVMGHWAAWLSNNVIVKNFLY